MRRIRFVTCEPTLRPAEANINDVKVKKERCRQRGDLTCEIHVYESFC
jgi:hypothetical protein